ncbi:MAG: diguanylate cyclase [Gammaproteobacteria bacterium]|nr:diguanylate cyclase [Gammaproteobacteria bacterium]MBU1980321.1 diguanylate cyclase [Gammaproteobacteria bacterium]
MNQLKFPHKLLLVGIIGLIPLVLLITLLIPRLNDRIATSELEIIGIRAIQPIKIFTSQAQAHRGLSQLALSRDQATQKRLAAFESQAEEQIRKLDDYDRLYGTRLNSSHEWQEIKEKWRKLLTVTPTLTAEQDFRLHTEFIICLNTFLLNLADAAGLSLEDDLSIHYTTWVVVFHIPNLIENLGQARALAARAAQKNTLSTEDRYRISALLGNIQKAEDTLLARMDKSFARPLLREQLKQPLQSVTNATHAFVFEVEDGLLLSDTIQANGEALFAAGTLAIDAAYRLCNVTLPHLEKMVQDRVNHLTAERRLIFIVTALTLALTAYLFLGFTSGLLGGILALKTAAKRVARGDFHTYASVSTRDELHDIASSFNDMANSLRSTVSQLRASEEKYRKIMEQAGDMILLADLRGKLIDANRMAEIQMGYSREELLQMNILDLAPDQEKPRAVAALARLAQEGTCEEEYLAQGKDGRTIPVHAKCTLIEHAGEKLALGIFRDISAARESHQRIEFLATHDPLTSLPNRSLLYDRIQQALARSERDTEPFALMFIDLDSFKNINDTFGHDQGDQLLQQVATRIQSCVRATDTAARLGGDEFTVLLSGTDRETAAVTAQRIVDELALPFMIEGQSRNAITASIGISLYPQDGEDRHSLMKHADEAMYRAKTRGNSYRFHANS